MTIRCFGEGDPLYERYHDEEWGFPVLDERGLFERLTLEAFQSGLSWRTILVLTGVTQPDEVERFPYRPSQILDGVADLVPTLS